MAREPRIQQSLFQAGTAGAVDMGKNSPIPIAAADPGNQAELLFRQKGSCKPRRLLRARLIARALVITFGGVDANQANAASVSQQQGISVDYFAKFHAERRSNGNAVLGRRA